jgi:hypothetical protein
MTNETNVEQIITRYEDIIDNYHSVLSMCYHSNTLPADLQHNVWETLQSAPDRVALTRKGDETAQGEGDGEVYFRTEKEKRVIEYSPLSVKDLALLITKEKPNKIFNSEWSATKPFLEITEYIDDERFMMFCNGWADKTPQEFTPIRLYQHLKYQGYESCFILTSRTAEQKGMSQEEVDRFLNHADEMNEELQSRITALEAENKRLREGKPEWGERDVLNGKSGRWMWHPTFNSGKPVQLFILDEPTPPAQTDKKL